jgi:hypothetical protein
MDVEDLALGFRCRRIHPNPIKKKGGYGYARKETF